MYQNDYIIAFDENGQPYIAHAGWLDNAKNAVANAAQQVANKAKGVGRGIRQNHKYILKVNENGRTRYFYKPEEVKAYYEAKRKGIKNPAEYAQKAADAASNAVDAVKNVASKAGNAAKSAFREATGQAARDRMNKAAADRHDAETAMQTTKQQREELRNQVQSARQAARQAEDELNRSNTALKGLESKWDSDHKKASEISERRSEAGRRLIDSMFKANQAGLDANLAMPWEVQRRRDAKAAQADATRENQRAQKDIAALDAESERNKKSIELTGKALDTARAKKQDAKKQEQDANNLKVASDYIHRESQHRFDALRGAYREADSDYNKNKAAYDKSIAGAVDRTAARARETAANVKDMASSAFNRAKESTNNAVTNAKTNYDRMKSEFRDKTGLTLKERAETSEKDAKDAERERQKVASRYNHDVDAVLKSEKNLNANPNSAHAQAERDRTVSDYRKSSEDYYKDGGALDTAWSKSDEAIKAREEYNDFKDSHSPKAMIDKARTAIKDKSEDLSAKAKSTAQSARDFVQGMIDNARSSTAKAVNEAWDKIPKNSDGTVNPFDKNFQSTYNDWKAKKDKYDSSLAGRAKDAAEKATDAVQDTIDQAKAAAKTITASQAENLREKYESGKKLTQEEMNKLLTYFFRNSAE